MIDPKLFALPPLKSAQAPQPAPLPSQQATAKVLTALEAMQVPVARFASVEYPLRISSLTTLRACEPGAVLRWRQDLGIDVMDRSGSKAADTGTAVGRAVELWHRRRDRDSTSIMQQVEEEAAGIPPSRPPFLEADLEEVARTLFRYRNDPRNIAADVPEWSLEAEVRLTLPPHPLDPTGEAVHLAGHLDQIRIERGIAWVWDLKHSRHGGPALVAGYSWQQCIYALAAEATFRRPVGWGGIIRTSAYGVRGAGKTVGDDEYNVFFPAGLQPEQLAAVADSVRFAVALARRGDAPLRPGDHCGWCPAGSLAACSSERVRGILV